MPDISASNFSDQHFGLHAQIGAVLGVAMAVFVATPALANHLDDCTQPGYIARTVAGLARMIDSDRGADCERAMRLNRNFVPFL